MSRYVEKTADHIPEDMLPHNLLISCRNAGYELIPEQQYGAWQDRRGLSLIRTGFGDNGRYNIIERGLTSGKTLKVSMTEKQYKTYLSKGTLEGVKIIVGEYVDAAMNGGIDFTASRTPLEIRNSGQGSIFILILHSFLNFSM